MYSFKQSGIGVHAKILKMLPIARIFFLFSMFICIYSFKHSGIGVKSKIDESRTVSRKLFFHPAPIFCASLGVGTLVFAAIFQRLLETGANPLVQMVLNIGSNFCFVDL